MSSSYIAIDLGASSGRVMVGTIHEHSIDLQVIHRFSNGFRKKEGHDRWDIGALWSEIQTGLKKLSVKAANEKLNLRSIGADSWGVDYGLFDRDGNLLEEPIAYRDNRTQGMMERVFKIIPAQSLYKVTGIQFMSFNTIFQLYAQVQKNEWLAGAERLLMIPDIIHYFLCGKMTGEYTNASTSQLLNVVSREWDKDIFDALELFGDVMPTISMPCNKLGIITESAQKQTGLPAIPVVLPATHDTGSAVAATPLMEGWAYISSGTWSLVGIESDKAYTDGKAYSLNYTNEGGVFNTIRFLKNVMGLWILESCRKEWQKQGVLLDYDTLMQKMEALPSQSIFIDPEEPSFLNPESMLQAIAGHLKRTGQKVETGQVELSAVILRSLALKYACVIKEIEDITERPIKGIQVVGGGSQNRYLNHLTADATGLPVMAGPVEATALGNIIIQAIADGRFPDLTTARDFIRQNIPQMAFGPNSKNPLKDQIPAFKKICQRLA